MSTECKFRCNCPITTALDIVGDKWTLVVVKQLLTENKSTFKELSACTEAIATNILSARLKKLEEYKIITKEKLPDNKKTNIYRLTEKGISLAPVLIELAIWSDANLREFHESLARGNRLESLKANKEEIILRMQESYRENIGQDKD